MSRRGPPTAEPTVRQERDHCRVAVTPQPEVICGASGPACRAGPRLEHVRTDPLDHGGRERLRHPRRGLLRLRDGLGRVTGNEPAHDCATKDPLKHHQGLAHGRRRHPGCDHLIA